MQVPETRYARVGDLRVAYQQWGSGPPLLIVPDLISNVEIVWEHELYRRCLEHLGQHMTCVYFDKRGIGMSDRWDEEPTLAQRNEDIARRCHGRGGLGARAPARHVRGRRDGPALCRRLPGTRP